MNGAAHTSTVTTQGLHSYYTGASSKEREKETKQKKCHGFAAEFSFVAKLLAAGCVSAAQRHWGRIDYDYSRTSDVASDVRA